MLQHRLLTCAINRTKKVLIVYLSPTNNTKAIAAIIHKYVGGTLEGVERDGQYLVIKDEKAKEAAEKVKKWLQKLKVIQ